VGVLDRAFAALYDPVLGLAERAGLAEERGRLLGDLAGHVVEIGAGTGANLPYLGAEVERVTLLEPVPEMATKLRTRLRDERAAGTVAIDRVEVLEAPAEALPVGDDAADALVSTLVLCTVDDLDRSLAEIRRVLRPGGALVLIEHVAAHGFRRRVQHAIEPAWKVIGRGCHLTRETLVAVQAAGFDTTQVTPWHIPGGGPTGVVVAGVARNPGERGGVTEPAVPAGCGRPPGCSAAAS
jgi:SAM-dependent methyltransferase